jgi:hypothetical protein
MEVSKLVFRKHTNKDKVTRLPVDKIVNEEEEEEILLSTI